MQIRSGYSFRRAVGHLPEVVSRLTEIGSTTFPLCDRLSTFGFVDATKLATKAGMRMIYGVELPATPALGEKRQTTDDWKFFAKSDLQPLHDAIWTATNNPGREPSILYSQALKAKDLIVVAGERLLVDALPKDVGHDFYVALAPNTPKGLIKAASARGLRFLASGCNAYPRESDLEFYRVALGRRASTQTYPQHICSDDELRAWFEEEEVDPELVAGAFDNRARVMAECTVVLRKARLFSPSKEKTLEQMCRDGAGPRNIDLNDPVYSERLEHELRLINEKDFGDYFYILADLVNWAKQRMVVGPARGSSCGSLVCYLLGITSIDPIPYGLLFARFIAPEREDLPDVDIDFADSSRDLVFEYAEERFGKDHVARLGTVSMFQARSALKQAGQSLDIPLWRTEKVVDSIIVRSSGDSRVMNTLEDTLEGTDAGRAIVKEYPEIRMAERMEGHPFTASQHAAGLLVTDEPIARFVAVDARTKAAWITKKGAEDLNLLKIDALGLTQLSVFERCLELIGEEPRSAYLEAIPLDDPAAFAVMNKGHLSGIFQFTGTALRSLAGQITFGHIDDLVALSALCRPGPLSSGGTMAWVRRRNGEPVPPGIHPMLDELTMETYGVVIYQETVMRIVKDIGNFSWKDTSTIRKLMSNRSGDESFRKFNEVFIEGAVANGLTAEQAASIWKEVDGMGSWCLSGDTALKNPHPNHLLGHFTIKELYEANGFPPGLNSPKRQKLLCWDGAGLKPKRSVAVKYSGKKETLTLKTKTGRSIRATKEHRFLMPSGAYRPLGELAVGDFVMIEFEGCKPTARLAARRTGTGSGRHNWRAKELKGGEFFGGARGNRTKLKAEFKVCQRCFDAPVQETHHRDMDHTNHAYSNLMAVCRKCHKQYHREAGTTPAPYQKGHLVQPDEITSIDYFGIEDTYDISMPEPHNNFLAGGIVVHNSFNKSHAVAYGIVSYWCAYLKGHFPLEFAAATLDAEVDPSKQLAMLRELAAEGVTYVSIDPEHSGARWAVAGRSLIGPLTLIKGVGPSKLRDILESRTSGKPLKPALAKQLANAKTDIDSLFPIEDAVKRLHPDLGKINIFSEPTPVIDVQCGVHGQVMIFGLLVKSSPRSENEEVNIAKRGGRRVVGPDQSLNLFFRDGTDEIFAKIDRFQFERLGRPIVENGHVGKSLYAVKGTCPAGFRMITVSNVRYLGEIDE